MLRPLAITIVMARPICGLFHTDICGARQPVMKKAPTATIR